MLQCRVSRLTAATVPARSNEASAMATAGRNLLGRCGPVSPLPIFRAPFSSPLSTGISRRCLPLHVAFLPTASAVPASNGPRAFHLVPQQPSPSTRSIATSTAATSPTPTSLAQAASTSPPRNINVDSVPDAGDVRSLKIKRDSQLLAWSPNKLPGKESTDTVHEKPPEPSVERRGKPGASAADATVEKKPRPQSKLRPLRSALILSPSAVTHVKSLLDQPEPKLLRIGTRRRGCSGLAYHLEYVDKADKLDEVVRQDGVTVLIEGRALLTVLGSTMDWVDEKLGSRFVFNNPNIKEQCGCGESFMV